jgi:hypothetical protein
MLLDLGMEGFADFMLMPRLRDIKNVIEFLAEKFRRQESLLFIPMNMNELFFLPFALLFHIVAKNE